MGIGIGLFERIPPCPGNPEDYILVVTRETKYWRLKRGKRKPAVLNQVMQKSANSTRLAAPAGRRVRTALGPYMHGITTGRLNVRLVRGLRQSLADKGQMKLSYLSGIELQRDQPMDKMLRANYWVEADQYSVSINIELYKGCIKPSSKGITDFYFDAILLATNLGKSKRVTTDIVTSPLYPVNETPGTTCELKLDLPDGKDWMVLLKLNTHEGNKPAGNSRFYRMKIIAAKG